jgi:hypothetical protein
LVSHTNIKLKVLTEDITSLLDQIYSKKVYTDMQVIVLLIGENIRFIKDQMDGVRGGEVTWISIGINKDPI